MDPILSSPDAASPDAASPTPIDPADPAAPTSLPTHRFENIKAGNNSVQLLVSTNNHLYQANVVEAGEQSWQVIRS